MFYIWLWFCFCCDKFVMFITFLIMIIFLILHIYFYSCAFCSNNLCLLVNFLICLLLESILSLQKKNRFDQWTTDRYLGRVDLNKATLSLWGQSRRKLELRLKTWTDTFMEWWFMGSFIGVHCTFFLLVPSFDLLPSYIVCPEF